MNLLVVYLTHQTAHLAVRERLAFSSPAVLAKGYARLRTLFPECEPVILSTCNRVEIYIAQPSPEPPLSKAAVAQFLAELHQVPLDEFVGELREQSGLNAVRHLFEVVSSLDSMVLGEPQIVNQVKDAYRQAELNAACGPLTHALFQAAIRVSARVRTETKLSEGRVSIASVAVGDFAKSIFEHFADKLVLVIGAGEMAEETLRYLQAEGVKDVVVANRSPERAEKVAAEWGGRAAAWSELDFWLGCADVIVSTTGAERPIVDVPRFRQARAANTDRTAFILDLGAPRDFDPAVGELENVFLSDIDSLEKICEEHRQARSREVQNARDIVAFETTRFFADFRHRANSELVIRLRETWHETAQQELEKLFRKCNHLETGDREAIERAVERIVNKLLHPPLEALRDESKVGETHGLIHALKRLFGL